MRTDWQVGEFIDNSYEVIERVGKGGMGTVYRVRHPDWESDLAVKVPLPELVSEGISKERFIREAHTWIDLGMHPNIVRCWFVRELGGIPLLFLDFLPGGSLKKWKKKGLLKPGEWDRILDFCIQACDGLGYAHSLGVIHRDVKPANLLIAEDGRLCVTDFGLVKVREVEDPQPDPPSIPAQAEEAQVLARVASRYSQEEDSEESSVSSSQSSWTLTRTGSILGTPEYGAPEQWAGPRHVFATADIYALGVMLFEFCCGRRPFDDGQKRQPMSILIGRHLSARPPHPWDLNKEVPEELCKVILQCLAKEPGDRPPSMMDLRHRLTGIYKHLTGQVYPRPLPRPGVQRADALNNKAVSLWNLGKSQEAFSAWREASKLDAVHPETVHNRSVLQWRLGQIDANEALQRLTHSKTAYPEAGFYVGLFHLENSNPSAAEAELAAALQVPSIATDPNAWRALGDARMYLQQYPAAERAYGKALEIAPDDEQAQQRREMARRGERTTAAGRVLFPSSTPRHQLQLTAAPSAVALLPDGNLLCATREALEKWNLREQSLSWRRELGEVGAVGRLQVVENRVLAMDAANGAIWDLQRGIQLGQLSERGRFFAITDQGETALIGGSRLDLVSLPDLQPVQTYIGHDKRITAVAVARNDELFLSASCDQTLRLWERESGLCLQVLEGHSEIVECAAMTVDGAFGVSGGRDASVRFWSLANGECLWRGKTRAPVRQLWLTRDERYLVLSCWSDEREFVEVWDITSGERLFERVGAAVSLDPSGRFLLSAGRQQKPFELTLWEIPSGRPLRRLSLHTHPLASISMSDDGCLAASASQNGTVCVWEVDEANRVFGRALVVTRSQSHEESERTAAVFLQHLVGAEEALASADLPRAHSLLLKARAVTGYRRDPRALSLNAQLQTRLARKQVASCWQLRELTEDSPTQALSIFSNGKEALSASGKFILLWELSSGSCLRGFTGHTDQVQTLALSEETGKVLSGGLDGGLRLWDVRTGDCIGTFGASPEGVLQVALSQDATLGAALTRDGGLSVWDLEQGSLIRSFPGHSRRMAVTPDCRRALVGDAGGNLCAWNLLQDGGQVALEEDLPPATWLDITDSGHFGITANDDMVVVWDLRSGRCLQRCLAQTTVTSVCCFQNGLYAISSGADGILRLWDLLEGRCLGLVEAHDGGAQLVSITPDGRFAVSAGADGSLKLWEFDWELDPGAALSSLGEGFSGGGFLERISSLFRGKRS